MTQKEREDIIKAYLNKNQEAVNARKEVEELKKYIAKLERQIRDRDKVSTY